MNEEGRAVVVFAHGVGYALSYDGCEAVKDCISEAGGGFDSFDLDVIGADYEAPDGFNICIASLRLIDDGPGDWPGSREVCLQLFDIRPATADEWAAYRRGEWPWTEQAWERQ